MKEQNIDTLLRDLKERAKELNCLYAVMGLTSKPETTPEEVFGGVVGVVPRGWQYPDACVAKIEYGERTIAPEGFQETVWVQTSEIVVHDEVVGRISIYYTQEFPQADEGPFLKEERKLLNSIAEWLGHFLLQHRLGLLFRQEQEQGETEGGWKAILELLRRTNPQLLIKISRKLTNYLCWSGSKEAEHLLAHFSPALIDVEGSLAEDLNRPRPKEIVQNFLNIVDEVFRISLEYLGEGETLTLVQKWIKEDGSNFLVNVLENPGSSNIELVDSLERYHHVDPDASQLPPSRDTSFRVALIRRMLTDQQAWINVAKEFIDLNDFYSLLHRVVLPANSHGKLGGKSTGLLLASQILTKLAEREELFRNIRTPKTWYLASDGILNFVYYNNLEDVIDQKYKDIGQVRQEYPYVVQVFKNSQFPPEIVKGLSMALDDFGDKPLIVRSSSLLEDRLGTSFAGKYKSLFIANQGTKHERLTALMDAVAEVYASVFSPDPIRYRSEHGLKDFHEEMGVMIQEVVGQKVGPYYLPAYAGVAFSNNEFRWSPRIRRQDGLVRLVVGLGTRAVDRLSDDYPILLAPGQGGLQVNVTLDEAIRYSPKRIDVINLETNTFETVDIRTFLKNCGNEFSALSQVFSVLEDTHLRPPVGRSLDFQREVFVATFDGLRSRSPFVKQMHTVLSTLQQKLGVPVDIEFASDGTTFYLLQCRPQSYGTQRQPAAIPPEIPKEKMIFSANRYVSNGTANGISHIVYVDPQKYSDLQSISDLQAVGRAVGRLNQLLPKRKFILMGPGRWGSRGDIRLGVNVTYSDINNAAILIEIARKQGDYVPDLSFGTHFFQDLVEEGIRYLPLYPDDAATEFNEAFLTQSHNILTDILPQYKRLASTIRVIDIAKVANGLALDVLMNGDIDKAVAVLAEPTGIAEQPVERPEIRVEPPPPEDHWRWRLRMAEEIAGRMDARRFGVKDLYVFGSTKNANAGPGSDIDLLVHFQGTNEQREALLHWLEGWSLCLSEMNFLRTGAKTDGLLDVHVVTDEQIREKTSFAMKIDAVTDQARKLPLRSP